MRILHAMPVYAPAWQFGGPVLSVSRLCEGLVQQGVDVQVITTNAGLPQLQPEQLGRPVQRDGVQVTYFPTNRADGPIRSRAMEAALPNIMTQADLVHLSAIWQPLGIPIQKAALAHDVPTLHSLRGALGPYSFQRGWWKKVPYYLLRERPLLQQAAGLHVTSQQERRELRYLGLKPPRYVLPNPMDLGRLRPDEAQRHQWRQQLGIHKEERLLLICGRQHHKKGLDLLPAVLEACKRDPWRLLLVGADDDGSGKALQKAMRQGGLGQRLLTLPTLPANELGGIYNAADLLLLPSRHENFGNVVIEALACGCAVAISDRTGVAGDLLAGAPADYGIVMPRRSQRWSDWLHGWFCQPLPSTRAATDWVAERYSQEAVAKKAIEVYQQILQTRSESRVWP